MTIDEIVKDHLNEVRTWLSLLETTEDPTTDELIAKPELIAEVRALLAILEEALETRDVEKMQQAHYAYEACDFFTDPIALDPDIWGGI